MCVFLLHVFCARVFVLMSAGMCFSDQLHCFKFTVYEVSYEDGILWKKKNIQVPSYIMLQGKWDFIPSTKCISILLLHRVKSPPHAHDRTRIPRSWSVGHFLLCKSVYAPDGDVVESKSSNTPHVNPFIGRQFILNWDLSF